VTGLPIVEAPDDDVSSHHSDRSSRSQRRRKKKPSTPVPTGIGYDPLTGSSSLLPPLAGVIDSSVGKATIPGQISRAGIRDIARVEVMQALRDQRPSIISEVAPVVKRKVLSTVTKLI